MSAPTTGPAVTICVLAFNEAANLAATVRELHVELIRLSRPFELLLINDGSTDGTREVMEELATELTCVRLIHHPVNQGLGGVYRTGFAEARGEFVTFFPADGQFPPGILTQFLPHMATNDLVLGYLPERPCGLAARFLSWAERALLRVLLGQLPRFQGVMMFRRELLDRIPLHSQGRGWMIVMELILKASREGCRITSLPTSVRPRLSGESKVKNLRTICSNLRQLLAFAWQVRRSLR
ncbi:MAG: glycosyltransferase family 2 protein [Verrucomicrobia bacterium]|nr:glycosyltransferase family 2 protein [Verrucomicrobiota bacterium]